MAREGMLFKVWICLLQLFFLPIRFLLWPFDKMAERESLRRTQIEAEIASRVRLNDGDFVFQLGIAPEDRQLALLVRDMLGSGSRLFCEQIHPDDDLDGLRLLGGKHNPPWDWEDLAENWSEELAREGLMISDLTSQGRCHWGYVSGHGRARDVRELLTKLISLRAQKSS